MKHHTKLTRSFVYLLVITLSTAYAAFVLAYHNKHLIPTYGTEFTSRHKVIVAERESYMPTEDWIEYTDKRFPITFRHPSNWTVKANTAIPNFYAINLSTPDKGFISIYISETDYFAFKGFTTKPYSVDGFKGMSWRDAIIAVRAGDYYYTFDASQNSKPIAEFKTLLKTMRLSD